MASAVWAARRLQAKNDQIRKLENRIKGYKLQLPQSRQKIQDLTTRLSKCLRSESTIKSCTPLRDYIFLMLFEIKIA
jgi:flagellar biosynthesis chaperone FliJ